MILTTQRLRLAPMVAGDAATLFAILGNRQAMRFWHRPAIARLEVVEEMVAEQLDAMARGLCRYWTATRAGDPVGSIDLSLIANGGAELGFLFRPDQWGQGLASEAAAAVVAHGFSALKLDRLTAQIDADNRAAARVLEKTGFALIEIRHGFALASGELRDCAFYGLRR